MPSTALGRGGKSAGAVSPRLSFVLAALVASLPWASTPAAAAFVVPPPAPPLPPPSGAVVSVSTVAGLESAVAALTSNTTISIAPGTYLLTQELRVRNGVTNVALRGSTGNRDDVVIKGSGMNTPGVNICVKCENAQDVLIANLSIGEAYWHPIQLQGEAGCDRVRLYNVRVFDGGEQLVKGTVNFSNPDGVDGGIVEYSVIEYSTIGPSHGYTNGVDIHNGDGWTIRYNLFRNIRVPLSAPQSLGPAVLMWSGSRDTVCEKNTFVDCERAIAYGLGPQAGFAHGHEGGRISDNFISRAAGVRGDSAISVWDSPGTKVLHNTVLQNGSYPDSIEYRFPGSSGLEVKNNLTDGAIRARDGAAATLAGNFTGATPSLFAGPAAGDLHLLSSAAVAIDQGVPLTDCPEDWDGDSRPQGAARDIGADEYRPPTGPPVAAFFHTLTPCRVLDTRNPNGPWGGPALTAAATRSFTAGGRCGIPSTARAISANLAVTQSSSAGNLRVYAGGTSLPPTSALNYGPGQTRANNAIIELGAGGVLTVRCDQAAGSVHFLLDVNGYFE